MESPNPGHAAQGKLHVKKSKKNFTQIENILAQCPDLSDGAFRCYVNILSRDWGDDPDFPTLAELAAWQRKTVRSIFTYICELRQANLLRVIRRGLGEPNDYEITEMSEWDLSVLRSDRKSTSDGNVLPIRSESSFRSGRKRTADPYKVSNTSKNTDTHTDNGAEAPPAAAEPPAVPSPMSRAPSLKDADPAIHARREAIKAHYLTLTEEVWSALTANRRKWLNHDAEQLARRCTDPAQAIAAIEAVRSYHFVKDGEVVYPYRAPLKLSRVVEMWANIQRGELRSQKGGGKKPLDLGGTGSPAHILEAARRNVPDACSVCKCINGTHDRASHERAGQPLGGAS